MNYQNIIDMALDAYTLKECMAAETAISQWLSLHPGDLGLHEVAGQLGIVKAAAIEREAREQAYSIPDKRLKTAAH